MVYRSGLEIPCANQQDSAENAGICGKLDAHEAPFTPCSDTGDGAEVGTQHCPNYRPGARRCNCKSCRAGRRAALRELILERYSKSFDYLSRDKAQGTSAFSQDGNRLEAKPAGPVRKDAPCTSISHTEGAA